MDTKYPAISFDPEKDRLNLAKHGVSLGLARELEWEGLAARPDLRFDYGEARYVGYAPLGERVYSVVFVERGGGLRIISLRKANDREVATYVRHRQQGP